MGNVLCRNRSWLVVGVINAVVAFGVLFYWNSSAADDTLAGLATDGALTQAVKSERGSAETPVAEKPAAQPTATSYSLSATDNDEKVIKALAKTVTLDFTDTPLRDALAEIGKQQGIRVWVDERALADLNITSETPVTRKLSDVSLKSALRLLLRPLQLTFRADAGVLQITSQAEYDNQLEIRVYPVGDLLTPFDRPEAHDEADFDSLIDVISASIAPTSWDNVGGPGSMSPHGQSLVVSQTAEVHEQIEGLVRMLRKVRGDQRKQLGGAGADIKSDERTRSIERALVKPVAWEFNDIPLRDAANFIAKESGIQIQFDERALADLNITSETPVTSQLGGIPLKDSLRLLLSDLQLTYVIDNEVLSITSQAEADNLLQVRVYPVGDLLDCESDKGFSAAHCDFDSLIDVISTTVAPTSWESVGGPANIPAYEGALALVISQTQEVHELIEPLLARMRQARPPRREKTAAASTPEDKSGLTTRVYALWQFGPQRERHADNFPVNPAGTSASARRRAKAQAENLEQFSGAGSGVAELGFGGGFLGEEHFAAIPPQGVPAEQAAGLIRRVVEPDAWKQPGTVLQAAPNRLVIRQTATVLKKTEELLQLLGPWREVKQGVVGGGGFSGMGGFGGAFQVADDPFESPKANAASDPFGAPASQSPATDPFGGPAPPTSPAADPFASPAQKRPGPPATASVEAKAAKAHAPTAPYLPSAAESRVREQLGTLTEMDFNDVPIRDGLAYLKDQHGIEIQIDEKELSEIGVKKDSPVTLQVKGISLRSALRLLLSQLSNNATFVVSDEVLLITTREGARQRKSVRIYDVSDFAEPPAAAGSNAFGPQAPGASTYAAGSPSGVHDLVNVIEQAIAPGTWGAEHGSGVVPLVRNDFALLVVHHSANVQDEIVDLLSSLREMRKPRRRAER